MYTVGVANNAMINEKAEEAKPLLLVFPHNVLAHYLRCLRLAAWLRPHFRIQFLFSDRYASFVSEAGYATFSGVALDADTIQQGVQSFDFSWLNEKDLFRVYQQQVALLQQLMPQYVLGDMAPTLGMAAEKTGVTYLSLVNGYFTRYYAHPRKIPSDFPLYQWLNRLPRPLLRYMSTIGEQQYFAHLHRPFQKIRSREGLSLRHTYMQELEGDITLVPDLASLFPQQALPDNYHFLPPLFHPLQDGEEAICHRLDRSKKTLLVTMGSTGNWQTMAFLNHPAFSRYNLVAVGDKEGIVKGAHVVALPFTNSRPLFEAVDLVICHGGNGTCYQALSCGIPVWCYTAHLEQEYNVEGLQRAGLGIWLNDIPVAAYPSLIEQWLQKKGSPLMNDIQEQIAAASLRFEQVSVLFSRMQPGAAVAAE